MQHAAGRRLAPDKLIPASNCPLPLLCSDTLHCLGLHLRSPSSAARHSSAAVRSYYPTLAHALFSRGIFSVQWRTRHQMHFEYCVGQYLSLFCGQRMNRFSCTPCSGPARPGGTCISCDGILVSKNSGYLQSKYFKYALRQCPKSFNTTVQM